MGLSLVKDEAENINGAEISFDQFWEAYPRRQARKEALKAWQRIDPKRYEAILAGVESWKRSDQWMRDGGQYIPMPASFLNGERWEDEVQIAIAAAKPCPWPRCRNNATQKYGPKDYCETHVAALKRGETP